MVWTKEFDEILKSVLRRADPDHHYGEELIAVGEVVENGFQAVKGDDDVKSLLRNLDTGNLTDDEFEVVHYAQTLADEDSRQRPLSLIACRNVPIGCGRHR